MRSVNRQNIIKLFGITPIFTPTPAWGGCMQTIAPGTQIPTLKCFEFVYGNILSMVVGIVVIALFGMLVDGGFKYLTSGSDPVKTTDAKKTLTYAVIGIVLLVMSYMFLRIVEAFTGVKVTIFKIDTN